MEDRFLPPKARLEDFVLILKYLSQNDVIVENYDVTKEILPGMLGALCQIGR